ncbi:MAG: exodeoxyribonuclease VII large subunit [Candidatus Omnitrophica bacterium]|nr:exodeoxyribonuclease VII large subunit [Candidatus Omnitrophota bacterium]
MGKEKIFTVLELNATVRELIQIAFPQSVWVCGEIQGLRPDRGRRHTYFELVQKEAQGDNIVAKVKMALFAGRKPLIEKRLKEVEGGFQLKNDIEVKLLCEVSLHPPTGQYSLVVVDIDTVYTLGKVAQNRLKIIEDLRSRGLLEKNKLLALPSLPLRIGLITAYDSAAYHDFINELKSSEYGFKVLIQNCHMQGKAVEGDVIKALHSFNKLSSEELDVIVVTRGGGSTADLAYFDNKKIAESIANSNIPVISAIGHQINTTIADMVSHTFCMTPTKAAGFLVEKIRTVAENLDYLEKDIIDKAESFISDEKTQLQSLAVKTERLSSRYFRVHQDALLNKKHSILSALKIAVTKNREFFKRSLDSLNLSLGKVFNNSLDQLKYLDQKIKILSPENTLKRGYSITLKGEKSVKSIDDLEENDLIKTIFYQGSVVSEVRSKKNNL